MSEGEYDEIRDAAERNRVTVSEWVRRALREARESDRGRGGVTVHEPKPRYGGPEPALSGRVPVEMNIKEDLLEAVRARYRLANWRAAIEYALRRVAVRPMSKEEALAMEGAGWDGDLDQMRAGDVGELW